MKALESLLQLLAREGLIGPQRLKRLLEGVGPVAAALAQPAGEQDEEDEEDEEDEDDSGKSPLVN